VCLKYVSDAFTERREELERELGKEGITGDRAAQFLEDSDEYVGRGVFWVPKAARWDLIAKGAKTGAGEQTVGELINAAMKAIEGANPELHGVIPVIFNRFGVDERRLAELVDLIGKIGFGHQPGGARDVLGHVYEYCLERFAAAGGKRGGEFYTPKAWSAYWSRSWSPSQAAGYTTRAAARVACSYRRGGSSRATVAGRSTSRSTARS
jgi:type I restriction enzyme M protein